MIKTNSTLGSRDEVDVKFYTRQNGNYKSFAGGISILFAYNRLEYWLYGCSASWKEFYTPPPTVIDKVWNITIVRTSGITVIIHCNGQEVLNTTVSVDTCYYSTSLWKWNRNVKWIKFMSDSASDYYSQGTIIEGNKTDSQILDFI